MDFRRIKQLHLILALGVSVTKAIAGEPGYVRYPTICGNEVIFASNDDLWRVSIKGGPATRITSDSLEETRTACSPDGGTVAFSAAYDGPTEVYSVPVTGGSPRRRTWDGDVAYVVGWTPDGRILYSGRRHSPTMDFQLAAINSRNDVEVFPLSEAAQGTFGPSGTLFFTRQPFTGNPARQYRGGALQQLWRYSPGKEATLLLPTYGGAAKDAMYWDGRVYFLGDRSGVMNLWSVSEAGRDLRQLTHYSDFEIQSPSLSAGHIAYQLGADLHVLDMETGRDNKIEIRLDGIGDSSTPRTIRSPVDYLRAAHINADGSELILTARGQVFVAPVKGGELRRVAFGSAAHVSEARFMPGEKSAIAISPVNGESEIVLADLAGSGMVEPLTSGGAIVRWEAIPSPDGKWIVHQDKNEELSLLNVETRMDKNLLQVRTTQNSTPAFSTIRWSPDSRWLSFSAPAPNGFRRLYIYGVEEGRLQPVTSDRYNSESGSWSADGRFLYFLSDRVLRSLVTNPWGTRQPDPYFDKTDKVYRIALRSSSKNGLHAAGASIDFDGISNRLVDVGLPVGDYMNLHLLQDRLCWMAIERLPVGRRAALQCVYLANGSRVETIIDGVNDFEPSQDGRAMLVRKGRALYVFQSNVKADTLRDQSLLEQDRVDLKGWAMSVLPREDYRELFLDAWRLQRDYFYDRNMHGLNWLEMRDKYLPLVSRVHSRQELNDVIAQMVSELSVLHSFVGGGEGSGAPDRGELASLGAVLDRDSAGYVVKHIYATDPDRPDLAGPLVRASRKVADGDVIVSIDGKDVLTVDNIEELLRNKASKRVTLRLTPADGREPFDSVVVPVTMAEDGELRYREWEYTRRETVENIGRTKIGYLHLRGMSAKDFADWAENFYPVADRAGLIMDLRHAGGGNADSWILSKLARRAWMYWQPRVGLPMPNMPYAFSGHMVLLVDEWTGSAAETFAEGFRRLGLGKIIGTRTMGAGVWLTNNHYLVDGGLARTPEVGQFTTQGEWLIEGRGVSPDLRMDNLPVATFHGRDAQLIAAIEYLEQQERISPVVTPKPPAYPNEHANTVDKHSNKVRAAASR
jgi:tricorn protease